MAENSRPRSWMRIATKPIPVDRSISFRQATPADAEMLGALMDVAYQGTVDHEGESPAQCVEEMRGTLTGKYGPFLEFASFLIEENGEALSTALVTYWKDQPLVAFSMTAPAAQGRGYAGFLLEQAISALHAKGYPELFLVVTDANIPALSLYKKLGFEHQGESWAGTPAP
jgi:GNAT superfamily N-acetyltransferase